MFKEPRSSLPKVFIDKRLEVKKSPLHGWGVFSKQDIKAHELIESAPVILCHQSIKESLFEINNCRHILMDYPFTWQEGNVAYAMGWAPLYNHSNDNNCVWRQNYDLNTIEITTVKNIKLGEELTVKYLPAILAGGLWFDDGTDFSVQDAKEASRSFGVDKTFDWSDV